MSLLACRILKSVVITISLLYCDYSFTQIKKVKYEYPTGSIYATGKILICPGFNDRYPGDETFNRKVGTWKYFYPNGTIQRIENYKTKRDCNSKSIPDGTWTYFESNGNLSKKEDYKDGILWMADVAKFYCNDQLSGEIKINQGQRDTFQYIFPEKINLIKNGDFRFYLGSPELQTLNGQQNIDEQIPFWFSPLHQTADYYNVFRRLKNVPNNISIDNPENYPYVGLILYYEPHTNYSEYITGEICPELIPGRKYQLSFQIRLSTNAGYTLNHLGILFTESQPSVQITSKGSFGLPQITITELPSDLNEWKSLNASYTASGKEQFVTFGRFSEIENTVIKPIVPQNHSEGGYNQSAYYLIRMISLVEDTMKRMEIPTPRMEVVPERINFQDVLPTDSLQREKTYILHHIYFEFDKAELLPGSLDELYRLLDLLRKNNQTIIISGHTDNVGSDEYNKQLSLARAKSVSDWLIANGIDRVRILVEGHGAQIPIVENNSEENRALNRRVEFRIK